MASESNSSSKRLRSEDSTIERVASDNELLSCPFCTFHSHSSDELDFHTHIQHQHLCSQCLHVFPCYFLLDLHMEEKHNSYFSNQSYRCLIESCTKIFSNLNQRFEHLNTEHYTKNSFLYQIYCLFSNQTFEKMNSTKSETKFGCDSQKTFIRNPRLKPRQLLETHWDADD